MDQRENLVEIVINYNSDKLKRWKGSDKADGDPGKESIERYVKEVKGLVRHKWD